MNIQLLLTRLEKLKKVSHSKSLLQILFREHVMAGVEHESVLSPKLRCIVDIGANKGQFALAARHFAKKAHIFSFEPLPGPAKKYLKIFNQDRQVTLHQTAIGPQSGKATIHISQKDDSSSPL